MLRHNLAKLMLITLIASINLRPKVALQDPHYFECTETSSTSRCLIGDSLLSPQLHTTLTVTTTASAVRAITRPKSNYRRFVFVRRMSR